MRFALQVACAVGVAVAIRPAAAAPANPQQQIAMIAKPSVMRVLGAYVATFQVPQTALTPGGKVQESIGGSGTGFFITADGFIATNAHVVAAINDGDAKAKDALRRVLYDDLDHKLGAKLNHLPRAQLSEFIAGIALVELKKLAYVVLPNGDHLNYEIKQFGAAGTGRDCALIKVKADSAPSLPIGDSSRSQVEDPVVVLGYPGVADFEGLLDEKSQLEATVTDGAISSLKHAASGEPILQISAPITHGNSGGPAIDQHGNVIGLATFGNQGEVQGFNFLVASATLMELVKDGHLDVQPSPTSIAWRAGLERYWNDEYTEAIAKFEEVETAFPAHSEARNLIRLSHQAQKDGKEKQTGVGGGLAAGLVFAGFAAIGIAVWIARRSRRPPAVPPGGPATVPVPPGGPAYGPPAMPGTPPPFAAPAAPAGPRPQLPMYGRLPGATPQTPVPAQQMYGRIAPPSQAAPQIAKTVAVGSGIAPTAFGSLSVGSVTCTRGELAGQRFALTATGIIIGRQPGVAHVLVNDHRASGKHVWIGLDNGILVAVDQNTTNGTYINDVARGRITRSPLRDGDVVIVGEPDCLSLQIRLGPS
ncbi:MAG TPA: trypsin-like peptidase domain-containing protein [Kofleriaceae bacterium]|nr:trypsin-like peptidase domain-containing protein [Kofleriaceae bacterium]